MGLGWPRDPASHDFQQRRRALMDLFQHTDSVTPLPEKDRDGARLRRVSNG